MQSRIREDTHTVLCVYLFAFLSVFSVHTVFFPKKWLFTTLFLNISALTDWNSCFCVVYWESGLRPGMLRGTLSACGLSGVYNSDVGPKLRGLSNFTERVHQKVPYLQILQVNVVLVCRRDRLMSQPPFEKDVKITIDHNFKRKNKNFNMMLRW